MNSERKYKITAESAMEWAKHELDSVGRIAAVQDVDIQYTYAMCTVNSMLHLRKALMDVSENPNYSQERARLLQTLDGVERVISHLIKDYGVDLNAIRAFNTRKIMGNIGKFNTNTTRRINVGVNAKAGNAKPTNAKPVNTKPANVKANVKPAAATNATNVKPKGFLGMFGL